MNVLLDPAADEDWAKLHRYAAWSIHVELYPRPDQSVEGIGTLHDCGYSISAYLTEREAAELQTRLAGLAGVVLADAYHAQQRALRRRNRQAWIAAQIERLRRLFRTQ